MATRSIVPRVTGEGSIGTALRRWGNGIFNSLSALSHNLKLNSSSVIPSNHSTFEEAPSHDGIRTVTDDDPVSAGLFNKIFQQVANRLAYADKQIVNTQTYVDEQIAYADARLNDLKADLQYGVLSYDVSLHPNWWVENDSSINYMGDYIYHIDIPISTATENAVPYATIVPESLGVADKAQIASVCQTLDKKVRFFAKEIPTQPISMMIALLNVKADMEKVVLESLPTATYTSPGLVTVGDGLSVDIDGNLSVDTTRVITDTDLVDETTIKNDVDNILNS